MKGRLRFPMSLQVDSQRKLKKSDAGLEHQNPMCLRVETVFC